jgi:hypothetical protein
MTLVYNIGQHMPLSVVGRPMSKKRIGAPLLESVTYPLRKSNFFVDFSTIRIPEVLRGLAQASSFLFPPPYDCSSRLWAESARRLFALRDSVLPECRVSRLCKPRSLKQRNAEPRRG